ncbi:AP2 domain-containing protein [Oscillochloris sp. ZM17-4]|uniref:AP2 domain-containing protein n=1 Tax=Oscillochloris sp. ZM17-4 TaxID=2866714 RepID=UPI001C733EE8|nr:AP2 domain-containing protein [Oscillochloris sp. ZM17-4]MBX0328635.1 AP2 domain-containing protein [Oscillochloris sp. ZM17-4]
MSTRPHRTRINADDDTLWEQLVQEAAQRIPHDLAPPLSEVSVPGAAEQPAAEQPAAEQPAAQRSPRGPRTTRYLNVTRMDYPKAHGYFVRVTWKGVQRAKLFSDGVYGDRFAALAAALDWRDKMTKELGKPAPGQALRPDVGVNRVTKGSRDVFEATWLVNGKQGRTSFSVRKHGIKKARALALAARQRALAKRQDDT